MSRDHILHKVRTALGRTANQEPSPCPPVRIVVPAPSLNAKVDSFCREFEALNGKIHRASSSSDAVDYVRRIVNDRQAVASNAPLLRECGVTDLPSVRSGLTDREELRALCST